MRKRLSLILACLFFFTGLAVAQNTVSGTVIDGENNEPIIGASVFVKGTKVGAVTDIDGHFSLSASSATPTLEVTYIGMKKVTVKGGKNIKITMYPDAGTLEEVVVNVTVDLEAPVDGRGGEVNVGRDGRELPHGSVGAEVSRAAK